MMMNYSVGHVLPAIYGVSPSSRTWTFQRPWQKSTGANEICVSRINADLMMKKPLFLKYFREGNYYCIVFERGPVLINIADEQVENLANRFREEILDAWNYYAIEKDENMTNGARKIKAWLKSNLIKT